VNREQFEVELIRRGFTFDAFGTGAWKNGRHVIELTVTDGKHGPKLWDLMLRDVDAALADDTDETPDQEDEL
jgi:hypothetical protein